MREIPHINNRPLEEISRGIDDLPPEEDISISLEDPDAIEKLETLQEEVALTHTGSPLPKNSRSLEVTKDDEAELEADLLSSDAHQEIRGQAHFDKNPDMWLRSIALKNDVQELLNLVSAGYDDEEIARLTDVISQDYPERFKKMNGGINYSQDPEISAVNLTADEYGQRLTDAYLSETSSSLPSIIPTAKIKNIELGDPIDDEDKTK